MSADDDKLLRRNRVETNVRELIGEMECTRETLAILWRLASTLMLDFNQDEVQEVLCDLALESEVAAGRATYEISAWLVLTIK